MTAPTLFTLTRVELRKLSDTRSGFWLLVATALLTVGVCLAAALILKGDERTLLNVLAVTLQPVSIVMPVAGILLVSSEWSQRTAMTTFTLVPRRGRVLAAKLLAGLILVAVSVIICFAVAAAVTAVFDGEMSLSGDLWAQAAFSAIPPMVAGVAFGAVLLASAPAIVLYFVLPTVFAALASIPFLEHVAPWLDQARAMTPLLEEPLSALQWGRVGTSAALWVLLPLAIGAFRVVRSDPR